MDAIMKLAEGAEPPVQQFDFLSIDAAKFKMFQSKCSIWEFNNISREEYIEKLEVEKKILIITYYKHMSKGMHLFFVLVSFFHINS